MLSFCVYYNSKIAKKLLVVKYLTIGLTGVTKSILIERRHSFIHQKIKKGGGGGSIWKEIFEKEVSSKLEPKIKPTNSME